MNPNVLKLKFNCKQEVKKPSKTQKVNNIVLKNDWVKEAIKAEIQRYLWKNENDNMIDQNFRDTEKNKKDVYIIIKKQERPQINSLTLRLKELE